MMIQYSQVYKNGPTDRDLQIIKKDLSGDTNGFTWEEYYWGVKCICTYDEDDFDPQLLALNLNNAFKRGLTVIRNKECYLDAIRILSKIYFQLGKYELALNTLGSILELDPEAPDWVYHDFVTAQNRTKYIRRNLKSPEMFLEDLSHNDNGSRETKKKQANIFKEFLAAGIRFIADNSDAVVAMDLLRAAAGEYGLADSKEWKLFEKVVNGDLDPNDLQEEYEQDEDKEETSNARPLIISLFPEDEEENEDSDSVVNLNQNETEGTSQMTEQDSETLNQLHEIQKELERKNKELESAGSELIKMNAANESLRTTIAKYQKDIDDYERIIQEKESSITEISERLINAQQGTIEQRRLEEELNSAREYQTELVNQYNAMRTSLDSAEKKLLETEQKLEEEVSSNEELRQELLKAKQLSRQSVGGNRAADVMGRYSTYIYITADKLADWLEKNLRSFHGWWDACVIAVLSPSQVLVATEARYSSLRDFDLAALLRILKKNWYKLKTLHFMPHSSYESLDQMFDLRNRWAHFSTTPLSKDELVEDLNTLMEFLSFLDCESSVRNEIVKFTVDVQKMDLT